MTSKYRDTGAKGALLDEYEKAILELYNCIDNISDTQLPIIVDSKTKDKNCESIQSVLNHLIFAGNAYNAYISNHIGQKMQRVPKKVFQTKAEFKIAMDLMFEDCLELFLSIDNNQIEVSDPSKKIISSWTQIYDIEQLMEHAIVHVLRHRRQIERFLIKIENHIGS